MERFKEPDRTGQGERLQLNTRKGLVRSVLRGFTRVLGRGHSAARSPASRALVSTETNLEAPVEREAEGDASRTGPGPSQPPRHRTAPPGQGGGARLDEDRLVLPPARNSRAARLPGPRDSRALGPPVSSSAEFEDGQGPKQHPFIRTDTAGSFLVPLNSAMTLQRLNRSSASGPLRQTGAEGQTGMAGGMTDSTEFGQPTLPLAAGQLPPSEHSRGVQGAAQPSGGGTSSKSASDEERSFAPDILLASTALTKLRKQQKVARADRNSAYKAEAEALVPAASAHLYYSFATAMVRGHWLLLP